MMIECKEVPPRGALEEKAYVVIYLTPRREGHRRFGGYKAREKATAFGIELLEELLDKSPD